MKSRRSRGADRDGDVPTTVLIGRGWRGAERAVDGLARRLARRLAHDVETLDLECVSDQLRAIVNPRGASALVLLPLALDETGPDLRRIDALTSMLADRPTLRAGYGQALAIDDVARMLGDRARDAARSLGARRRPGDVVVVIATKDRVNPASNAEVARLARLVYEAHGFAEVAYAFVGLTTPRLADVVARWARLGARDVVVVPHLLFDRETHRRLVHEARAAASASGIDVTVARRLDTHAGLVGALVRRHLEVVAGLGGRPWINPRLLRILDDGHGHARGMSPEWEARLATLLPPRYRDPGVPVSSAPMGAAPLARDADGRVAWDRMWRGFCELALAGGPPHRGALLEPGSADEARANPGRYAEVLAELARALRMVTGLRIVDGSAGWIGLECDDDEMAIWLMRAIVVENIMVRREGAVLFLPAGPRFALEGEIKSVVTAVAKTHHYWMEHQASRARRGT
jgi:sirohydrochlorin cobaltochelatase